VKSHKGAVVKINDRVLGMLKLCNVQSKETIIVSRAINTLREEWSANIHMITSDNGR
jgi:hypothetical protein